MKIKLRKSTFPAGTLVTYHAYAGSTSLVAVTADKSLVGVWSCGCTVFPPLTFFLYGRPPGGFKGGGSIAYSATTCATVFGKGSPLKMPDVACTKGLLQCCCYKTYLCKNSKSACTSANESTYKLLHTNTILSTCIQSTHYRDP